MLGKLGHKCLTETHNFIIALTLGIKVGAALAAAHRQTGETVLEYLLEAEEFDNGSIYAGMETQTTLVGANSGVELNSVTTVDLNLAAVVNPGNPEYNEALRLNNALENTVGLYSGISVDQRFKRL